MLDRVTNWNFHISEKINKNQILGCALIYSENNNQLRINEGHTSLSRDQKITLDSKFEIGSLTKIFTGLICSELIIKKQLSLDTSLGEFDYFKSSVEDVKKITLKELLSHSSGLPRLPSNINPKDTLNPYVDYTENDLKSFLNSVNLYPKEYCYSNIGYALIGKIIDSSSVKNFEEHLNDLLSNLNLKDTYVYHGKTDEKLCSPYNHKLELVKHWEMGIFKSAGGLVSTSSDLIKFCNYLIGKENHDLKKEVSLSMESLYKSSSIDIAFGWHINNVPKYFRHDGATYGHYSKIRIMPSERRFLISLSNTYCDMPEIDIV